MKHARIHLVWFCVTLVFGMALSQCSTRREKNASREREQALIEEFEAAGFKPSEEMVARKKETRKKDTKKEEDKSKEEKSAKPAKTKKPKPPTNPDDIRKWLATGKKKDRQRAIKAIRDMKDSGMQLQLITEALQNRNRTTREEALKLLYKIPGPGAAQLAISALKDDGSGQVRATAAWVLSRRKDPGAAEALERTFYNQNESMYFKTLLAVALKRQGRTEALGEMVAYHTRSLDSIDGSKRESGVRYLAWLGTEKVLPPLNRALTDTNSDVRREAVKALKNTGLREAIPLLEGALNDSEPRIVREAEKAIAELKKKY